MCACVCTTYVPNGHRRWLHIAYRKCLCICLCIFRVHMNTWTHVCMYVWCAYLYAWAQLLLYIPAYTNTHMYVSLSYTYIFRHSICGKFYCMWVESIMSIKWTNERSWSNEPTNQSTNQQIEIYSSTHTHMHSNVNWTWMNYKSSQWNAILWKEDKKISPPCILDLSDRVKSKIRNDTFFPQWITVK